MDFSLSTEQSLFRDTMRAFVDREIIPVATEWEHSGRYPTEIVEGMKQLGLFGMTVPAEYGGLDVDMVSSAWSSRSCPRVDGDRRYSRQPFALVLDDRAARYAGTEGEVPPGPRDRAAPDGASDLPSPTPAATCRAFVTTARRGGRPLRGERGEDVDHQCAPRQPAARPA